MHLYLFYDLYLADYKYDRYIILHSLGRKLISILVVTSCFNTDYSYTNPLGCNLNSLFLLIMIMNCTFDSTSLGCTLFLQPLAVFVIYIHINCSTGLHCQYSRTLNLNNQRKGYCCNNNSLLIVTGPAKMDQVGTNYI